jgi:hypothetical protein
MKKTDDMERYARSYIDTALEVLGRLGQPSEISAEDYENAVRGAASAFEDLREVGRRSGEREPIASN